MAILVEKKSFKIVDEIIKNASKKPEEKSESTTIQMIDNLSNEICMGADLVYLTDFFSL